MTSACASIISFIVTARYLRDIKVIDDDGVGANNDDDHPQGPVQSSRAVQGYLGEEGNTDTLQVPADTRHVHLNGSLLIHRHVHRKHSSDDGDVELALGHNSAPSSSWTDPSPSVECSSFVTLSELNGNTPSPSNSLSTADAEGDVSLHGKTDASSSRRHRTVSYGKLPDADFLDSETGLPRTGDLGRTSSMSGESVTEDGPNNDAVGEGLEKYTATRQNPYTLMCELFQMRTFWKFVVFTLFLINLKSIFRHLG
jgi:hypothetical protein